jgi:hypothetical protein
MVRCDDVHRKIEHVVRNTLLPPIEELAYRAELVAISAASVPHPAA